MRIPLERAVAARSSISRSAVLLVVLALMTLLGEAAEEAPEVDTPSRETRWCEDLDVLAKELPARHIDFRKLVPRKEFEREIQKLKGEVGQLSDIEVVFRLKRLLARLGIAHTRIGWPPKEPTLRSYPVNFHWFSDGLAIVAANAEHRNLIGAGVVEIGTLTPVQVVAALEPYVSYENGPWLLRQSAVLLRNVELLQHLGIAHTDGTLRLSLVLPNGDSDVVDVSPAGDDDLIHWIWAWEALDTPQVVRRHKRDAYWYEYLPEAWALYVQYNKCVDYAQYPFDQFTTEALGCAESNAVDRIVIDLRYNGGGNSSVVKPLVRGLKSHPILKGRNRVFVLIGPDTFSSGIFAAIDLRNEVGATLVGGPTGGKPNCYGNTPSFKLPNSQLDVFYCTRKFRLLKGQDPQSLEPDIPAAMTLADFLDGRDPALEAALRSSPGSQQQ